jgi:tetratricopeptide (TPR) repeat protein
LRKFIRFQLDQMGAGNEAHRFEDLSFELARARVASNVVRATGPVQSGGDQGRDFETFRTYLARSPIAGSAFVSSAAGAVIAFACTLNKRIDAKIRADLGTIFGGGKRPDSVAYFCVPDVPVALRHKLQGHCRKEYEADLELFDGQQISDMLSDGDTFWIAEHFLSVPSEMFPPVTVDAEYQDLKERWFAGDERGPGNLAEFLEIKRGLRRATFEDAAKPDLEGWMRRMVLVKQIPELERKATYELAVASLRGRGVLDAECGSLATYFDTLPTEPELEDIEDLTCLATYASSASMMGHLQNAGDNVDKWVMRAAAAISDALARPSSQSRRFRLLRAQGQNTFVEFWLRGSKDAGLKALEMWSEAAGIAEKDAMSDPTSLADLLLVVAPAVGAWNQYQALTDKVDALIAKREGLAAAGDLARDRAIAFADVGQVLLAIDQLQRAKENWFNAETLRGAILAMLLLCSLYAKLNLPQAARYHASMALYILVRSKDETMGELSVRSAFALADTFYQAGEVMSYLSCIKNIIPIHTNYRTDPDDTDQHDDFTRAISHGAIVLATVPKLAPEIASRAARIVDRWMIDDAYLEAMRTAAQSTTWSAMSQEDFIGKLRSELGQDIVNDIRNPVRVTWSALGIQWTIVGPRKLRIRADALAAILQIALVDLGNLDLVVIPSAVEIHLEHGGSKWDSRQEPDNGRLLWTLFLPEHDDRLTDDTRAENESQFGLAFIMQSLRQVSALPHDDFFNLFEARMERGLWKKMFFVRPPEHLMSEARAMADFEREDGPLEIQSTRPAYAPLAAPELDGPKGNAIIYSADKAAEMISNRYRRLGPFAARVVPSLMYDSRTKRILTGMHELGVKDWEIVLILFNIALNKSLRIDPHAMSSASHGRLMKDMATMSKKLLDGTDASPFQNEWLNDDELTMGMRASIGPVAHSWGLNVQRQTPDFDAIRNLLIDHFRHHKDDVAHDDWFGWNEVQR